MKFPKFCEPSSVRALWSQALLIVRFYAINKWTLPLCLRTIITNCNFIFLSHTPHLNVNLNLLESVIRLCLNVYFLTWNVDICYRDTDMKIVRWLPYVVVILRHSSLPIFASQWTVLCFYDPKQLLRVSIPEFRNNCWIW